jgi:hypothetical protein
MSIRRQAGLRRSGFCLLAGGLALLLTGCIWLRLLTFKNQLADFDRYVKASDQAGLVLQFVKPVLYCEDLVELLEVQPTRKSTNQNQQDWFWTFEKLLPDAAAESNRFEVTFTTVFLDRKLSRIAIPDSFLAMLPKPFVLGLFRSLGHAQVDRKSRAASAKWVPEGESKIPARPEVAQLLGMPFAVTNSGPAYTHLYKYQLKSPSLKSNETMVARALFTYTRDSDALTRIEASFSGLRIDLSFEPPAPAPKPKL